MISCIKLLLLKVVHSYKYLWSQKLAFSHLKIQAAPKFPKSPISNGRKDYQYFLIYDKKVESLFWLQIFNFHYGIAPQHLLFAKFHGAIHHIALLQIAKSLMCAQIFNDLFYPAWRKWMRKNCNILKLCSSIEKWFVTVLFRFVKDVFSFYPTRWCCAGSHTQGYWVKNQSCYLS